MPAGLPYFGMHDVGGIQTDHILTIPGHGLPPEILDVSLELRAKRAVIPKTVDPTVNF